LPERLILAETKWTLDGRLLKMGMLNNWKLISSLVDGKRELYQLPDEHTDRARQDAAMARTLLDLLRPWIAEENYWIVYAKGKGQFEATVTPRPGQFSKTIPIGTDEERDRLDIGPDGRWYHWTCELHGDTKAMYLQFAPKDAAIRFEFRIDGVERPEQVYLGERRVHPKQFPVELTLEDSASDPVMKKRFEPDKDGFYVMRYRSKAAASFPAQPAALDEKTIRQLRSLGYLR